MHDLIAKLGKLNEASRAMTACPDPGRLFDTILALVEEVFQLDTCAVLLLDGNGDLRIERARGYDAEVVKTFRGRPGDGITGRAMTSAGVVYVPDVRADASYERGVSGAVAELAAPMRLDGKVIGVLDAELRRVPSFTEEDLAIFGSFAAHAAVAVQNAQLHARLEREVERQRLLGQAARALSSSLDFDEVLQTVLTLARQALRFDQCAVLLLSGDELRIRASIGYPVEAKDLRIPLGRGVTGEAARSGTPVLVADVARRAGYIPGVTGGRCEMAAPLVARGRILGVLDAESPLAGAFTAEDLELLATFALHAAAAIANAEMYRELGLANERLHKNIIEIERMNRELLDHATTISRTNGQLESRVQELLTLQRASQTITSSLNLDDTLGAIVQMTREIIHASISTIKLLDEGSTELRVLVEHGEPGLATAEVLGIPLKIGDRTIGSFEVSRDLKFSPEERRLLETLASQAAIAIENARLFENTQRTYFETIRSLAQALEARDAYTKGHSERVMRYALRTAEAMGLGDAERRLLGHASLLHDIGKIGIADAILNKPSRLSNEDRLLIEQHPIFSDTIIGPLRFLDKVQTLVRHHHERFDGTGYPEQLRGEEIPLGARIIAVADSFDAMTSARPYRAPLPTSTAVAEIRRGAGSQFDPHIVEVFLHLLEEHGPVSDTADLAAIFENITLPGVGL